MLHLVALLPSFFFHVVSLLLSRDALALALLLWEGLVLVTNSIPLQENLS